MESEIEKNKNLIWMKDDRFECFISCDEAQHMDEHIKALYRWVTTDWYYEFESKWVPNDYDFKEEFTVISDEDENGATFFKVHKLVDEDYRGLFGGAWDDSPEPLERWEDMNANAYVYIKISEEEYNEAVKEYEEWVKNNDEQ